MSEISGGLSSGNFVVNFAAKETGSVSCEPSNNVEWTKSEYVPVWFIGANITVEVSSLFFTGKKPPPWLKEVEPNQSTVGQPIKWPNTPESTFVWIIFPSGSIIKAEKFVSSFFQDNSIAPEFIVGSSISK